MNPEASIKIHIYRGSNDGTTSCDFRPPNAIGHNEGDEHRTVLEFPNASDGLIAEVLKQGPALNAIFAKFKAIEPAAFEDIATALGLDGTGEPGLRLGVWEKGQEG